MYVIQMHAKRVQKKMRSQHKELIHVCFKIGALLIRELLRKPNRLILDKFIYLKRVITQKA